MACSLTIPLLVTLLAPAPAEPAPTPFEAAAPAPEDAEPVEPTETAPAPTEGAATEPAPTEPAPPGPVENPLATPPPATAPPPTPIAPIPPPPPRPIRWRLDTGIGIGSTLVGDRGYRAFAANRNLVHLDASTIFDFRLAEGRFFIGGGVAYGFARRTYTAHGTLGTWVRAHEPRVVGRASFMAIEGIDVFARVGVGPSIVDLELDSSATDFTDVGFGGYQVATQRAVLPRVDGQAGLSLYFPKRWLPRKEASRVGAGVELSAGYVWRGKVDVRPTLDRTDDPLPVTTTDFGELSLHGFSWGLGLFVRVM